jgi:hypothetical protein
MLQKIRKAGMLIGAAVVFLSSVIALAGSATLRDGASGASESRGQRIYETHCVACHGPAGHGDGEASIFLLPRPSDFTAERFKLRSTTAGSTRISSRPSREGSPARPCRVSPFFEKRNGAPSSST